MSTHDLPLPNSGGMFEEIVRDVFSRENPSAQLHGRAGQKQSGVDIYFPCSDNQVWIGIQCKLRSTQHPLLPDDLDTIAQEAESFVPPLKKLIIATTTPSDTRLQRKARELTVDRATEICILSWKEICARLMNHTDLIRKYYPELCEQIRVETHRDSFGLGVLVGALVESYFVLNALNVDSELHKNNVTLFTEKARECALAMNLTTELETLLGSLAEEGVPKEILF